MVMTHGWPGSLIELHRCIGLLTDPVAHGGNDQDAFRLVMPSLPGFGFSDMTCCRYKDERALLNPAHIRIAKSAPSRFDTADPCAFGKLVIKVTRD